MIKIKKITTALMLVGLSAVSLPSLSAELIQNGGFELHGADVYSINSWNTAEDGILGSVLVENDTVTDASGRNTVGAASGNYYGLLDSAAPSNQALYQTFSTGAVSAATLTFQMFVIKVPTAHKSILPGLITPRVVALTQTNMYVLIC
jgi:hypothetical protein